MIKRNQIKMNLKIGDFVQILDDTLEGVIEGFENDQVNIKDQDGFLHKYSCNQIVKIPRPLNIDPDDIEKIINQEKIKTNFNKSSYSKKLNHIPEIDLHIHELTDSTKNMTDFEILQLQLQTAEKRLVKAIKKKEKKLIFIHGVGKGRLKDELTVLFQRYKEIDFYDADFQKYGRGATEVYIYQNVN